MKRLLEGQQLQRTVPPTAGRVEPVVHLPGGLTLDDRSCWQYPTMLVGNVGSGKSTLMEQIRRPVLAHADRMQDTVVIFAAKPDVLRCRRPFVLIGTARDLTDSPLLRLPVQWQDTVLPDRLPEGSGRITINPGEFGMGMMQMADWGGTHTILLCLGQGLSASTELLDALNACGDYVLLCSSLSRAVPSRTGGLTTEGLLRSMRYLVVSSAGGDAQTLLQVLPSYESERVTNSIGFNTHHDRGGMMGHHGGSGFSFGQNREVVTKPVLSQDDLTGLRNNSEFLVYNQDLMRLWVGKIG